MYYSSTTAGFICEGDLRTLQPTCPPPPITLMKCSTAVSTPQALCAESCYGVHHGNDPGEKYPSTNGELEGWRLKKSKYSYTSAPQGITCKWWWCIWLYALGGKDKWKGQDLESLVSAFKTITTKQLLRSKRITQLKRAKQKSGYWKIHDMHKACFDQFAAVSSQSSHHAYLRYVSPGNTWVQLSCIQSTIHTNHYILMHSYLIQDYAFALFKDTEIFGVHM